MPRARAVSSGIVVTDRALPGGGQVPAPAPDVQVDAVGHRPVRFDAVAPLLAPVRRTRTRAARTYRPCSALARCASGAGQLDRDFAVGGDADRLVPVPLPGLPVGGEEPALAPPTAAATACSVSCAASRLCRVFSRRLPPRTTCTRPARGRPRPLQPGLERVQAAGLGEPLVLGPVTARRPLGALLPDRAGTAGAQRRDTGLQRSGCARAGHAGPAPTGRGVALVIDPAHRDDDSSGQLPFTGRPRAAWSAPDPSAHRCLRSREARRPNMLTHQTQHLLVLGR